MKLRHFALLLCAAVLLGLLLVELRVPPRRLAGVLENAVHAPLFGVITCILMSVLRASRSPRLALAGAQYLAAAAVALGLGLTTELAQMPGPRDASVGDFLNNVLGAFGGLAAYASVDTRLRRPLPVRVALAAFALAIALSSVGPVIWAGAAYVHRNGQFPVLIDGNSRLDLFFIARFGASVDYFEGRTIRIEFRSERWPGVLVVEPKRNWTAYRALVLDLENPNGEALPLGLAVRDRAHDSSYSDRFNREFELAARERQKLRVPLEAIESAPRGRRMQMDRIAGLSLIRTRAEAPRTLLLHSIRLE